MSYIRYFVQSIFVFFLFIIFKFLGLKASSSLGGKLFQLIGPIFRSKKLINNNIEKVFPHIDPENKKKIINSMWNNYGRVFAEYMFIKDFRLGKYKKNIIIEGKEVLEQIKNNKQAVFISGHFSNFELMAMQIELSGIKLAAIYRPLNNIFLNPLMESIRKKYICKTQIKKGISGVRQIIKSCKNGYSTALMIDQRVSQGLKTNFFNHKAFTTTIPAQLVKRFRIPVVPVSIKRINKTSFKITINKPIYFTDDLSIDEITKQLNIILEKMILENPEQWIWTHNRWK